MGVNQSATPKPPDRSQVPIRLFRAICRITPRKSSWKSDTDLPSDQLLTMVPGCSPARNRATTLMLASVPGTSQPWLI